MTRMPTFGGETKYLMASMLTLAIGYINDLPFFPYILLNGQLSVGFGVAIIFITLYLAIRAVTVASRSSKARIVAFIWLLIPFMLTLGTFASMLFGQSQSSILAQKGDLVMLENSHLVAFEYFFQKLSVIKTLLPGVLGKRIIEIEIVSYGNDKENLYGSYIIDEHSAFVCVNGIGKVVRLRERCEMTIAQLGIATKK